MKWLAAACGAGLLFFASALGTLVPISTPHGLEYLFAGPRVARLLSVWALASGALIGAYAIVVWRARSRSPENFALAKSGRWLTAIVPIGGLIFGLLPAAPGLGERASVVAYFLYDLRWWWLIVAVGVTLVRAHRLVGAPLAQLGSVIARWSPAARLLFQDAALFVVVVAWAIVTLPLSRFQSALHGDEPKYVRYCELWYQGGGLDVSNLKLVADQPIDARPALWLNVWRAAAAIPVEARALVRDLRDFAQDPAHFRWNRVAAKNAFITGKNGGVYQVHPPGTSLVLFPGYFLDRYLLSTETRDEGRWPSTLPMTNAAMLLTYGLCAVALFRLLRHALHSDSLAWLWSAAAMLTFPTAAFPFQLYPELPALLIVLGVCNYVMFSNHARVASALLAGAAAGALVWMHARFLLVIVVMAAAAILGVRDRLPRRARWMFVISAAAVVLSELAFDYHVTGSWLPSARWDATDHVLGFTNSRFVLFSIAYGLDRMWGLLPHALIMIGALPGLILMRREFPRGAIFVTATTLALVIAAAGHTLSGSGTTPDRLIVAIVPLLVWPVAVLVRRGWTSELFRSVALIVGVLSLHAALAYNWHHDKSTGPLYDVSVSGWKPNLAFPIVPGLFGSSWSNIALFCVWVSVILAAALLARYQRRTQERPPRPWMTAALLAGFIGFFTVTTAANGDWTRDDYVMDDRTSGETAASALLALDRCRICFSSDAGQTDWVRFKPNAATGGHADVTTDRRTVNVHMVVDGAADQLRFGRASLVFGDGSAPESVGVEYERSVLHRYSKAGTYEVGVVLELPSQTIELVKDRVEIR